MKKKLAIVVLHGSGTEEKEFLEIFNKMKVKIEKQIEEYYDIDEIAWKPIYWLKEEKYLDSSYFNYATSQVKWNYLREFLINTLSTTSSYLSGKYSNNNSSLYNYVHNKLKSEIHSLYNSINNIDVPLLILAHSFSSTIIYNYLSDIQNNIIKTNDNDFEKLNTLSGIITFGSNIPLFKQNINEIEFEFPPKSLNHDLLNKAKWLNFFDKDDVLGYPLKPLGESFDIIEDYEINVGSVLESWNLLSHNAYWDSNHFIKPVSNFIKSFL